MYLFKLFILFLYLIPNYSIPPYPYPISLLYGWYNEAFLHRSIEKNGNKVLDWHFSEYLGEINSSLEKKLKISIVSQTILLDELYNLHSQKLTNWPILNDILYRFLSKYNLCCLLGCRKYIRNRLSSKHKSLREIEEFLACSPFSPSVNDEIIKVHEQMLKETNFIMFLRRMETDEFQEIIAKISGSNITPINIEENLFNLFGIVRTEILRYALPELFVVFGMELTLVRPLEEFYTKYFNAESSILKWRIRQFIEYTLCLIDKNFDEEETQIWVEMTKHYWYGDTEMQIQYVKLKEFTVKEIKENITRYYLNMETIVEKELNPKTPSYILAVSESIQEVNKNIKIGKKNKLF